MLVEKDRLVGERDNVIASRDDVIAHHQRILADHRHVIGALQKLLKLLEEQLHLARQRRFGASSQKRPFQGDFFDEAEPADETRIQVLRKDGKVATADKWMSLVRGGPPDRPVVLFHYDASRSEDVPSRLLDGFAGVLQPDGYAGYNQVCRDNPITRIGCWDHARRKFVEVSKAAPTRKKGQRISKADVAIGKIRKLYAIERRINDLAPKQRLHSNSSSPSRSSTT